MRLYEDLRAAHEKDRGSAGEPAILGRRELYQLFSIATGVPEMLLRDDAPLRVEDVAAALGEHVIGQAQAVRLLSETIGVVKAGLQPSGKPGTFCAQGRGYSRRSIHMNSETIMLLGILIGIALTSLWAKATKA